jgi:NAD+ synthetase
MKIGMLQLNPVVGDLEGNARMIAQAVREAAQQGADFCMTSELALTGYPPRDLLLYSGFVNQAAEAAEALARELADAPPLLLGNICENALGEGKPVFNCAQWCRNGEVERTFRKTLLPTYDVFDEARYFEPNPEFTPEASILEFQGRTFAVSICEDAWNDKDFWETRSYRRDPLEEAAALKPSCILNLSASPLSLRKQRLRERMLSAVAKKFGVPLVYTNQVGGNDDLIFDGRSSLFDADGTLCARAPGFERSVFVVNIDAPGQDAVSEDSFDTEPEAWRSLVLGTRDYVQKSRFSKVLLGLSGGIDSALTAAIAVEALGAENVLGVLMPSPYSSKGSIDDSMKLAEKLGIKTLTLPIEPIMQEYSKTLAEPFNGYGMDTTEENIQSRIRGNLLMALSNKYGALLLTTGNKSELAVGYCTIYGDMSGGYAVISDVNKTLVFALCRWHNRNVRDAIPEEIISKPPSAELRPDQKDEDSLPPYEVLDAILELHVEKHLTGPEIVERGFAAETVAQVLRLVAGAEFKRWQAAPGIKLTPRSFGTGWRMPLACRRPL